MIYLSFLTSFYTASGINCEPSFNLSQKASVQTLVITWSYHRPCSQNHAGISAAWAHLPTTYTLPTHAKRCTYIPCASCWHSMHHAGVTAVQLRSQPAPATHHGEQAACSREQGSSVPGANCQLSAAAKPPPLLQQLLQGGCGFIRWAGELVVVHRVLIISPVTNRWHLFPLLRRNHVWYHSLFFVRSGFKLH